MSPMPSPRASSSILSAISLFAALACAKKIEPPTAVASAPALWHVGVAVQLDGTASKAFQRESPLETPALNFHWSFVSVPPRSEARLNDPTLGKPSFVPDVAGAYAVQLVVDDGVLPSAPVTASVDVRNDCAPVVTAFRPSPAAPGVGSTVTLAADVASPCDGKDAGANPVVAWRWFFASVPAGSKAVIAQAGSPQASFVADARGDYDVVLELTAALGLKNDAGDPGSHLKISIRACGDNAPAIASLASNPLTPDVRAQVSLSAVVTHADVEAPCNLSRSLAYAWQLTSVPSGSLASLNSASVKSPSFVPDARGDYVVTLLVTDELGRASERKTLTVSTTACGSATPTAAAVVTSPAGAIAVGQGVQLGVQVTDADNPALDGLNPIGTTDAGTPDGGAGCALALQFSYRWRMISAPRASKVSIATELANPSFTPDVPGDYVFSAVVTASTGKSSAPSFLTVTVVECGSLPVIATINAPGGWITGRALGPPDLGSTVVDQNATGSCVLTVLPFGYRWTLLSAPAGSTAALSGAPAGGASTLQAPSFTPDVAGNYQLGLVVTDRLGLESPLATATVQVGACNVPINVSAITTGGSLITGRAVQLSATVTDPNDPGAFDGGTGSCTAQVFPFSYSWTLVDQPAGSAAALNNATSAAPSLVPDKTGTYSVVLVVTDAAGNRSAPKKADIAIATDCTQAPSAVIAITSGAAVTASPVALSATPSDPNAPADGGCVAQVIPFSFAWTLVAQPSGSMSTLNNANAVNPSFVPDVAGDYTVSLVVTDAAGNTSAPQTFTVNVPVSCNARLTATISVNGGGAVLTGQAVTLTATVTDPNDPADGGCTVPTAPISYLWSLVGQPAGSVAALNNRAAAAPSFTPDVGGTYKVQLVVTDAAGNKSLPVEATFSTSADCNQPLAITAINAGGTLKTGSPVALTASFSDPNTGCGTLTPTGYQWALLARPPSSAAALDNPFVAGPSFTPDQSGTYVVAVRVSDALGNGGSLISPVSVNSCGSDANVTVTASAAPTAAQIGQSVRLTAEVSDSNGAGANCGVPSVAPFSYAWQLVPPATSTAVLGSAIGPQVSFVPDVAATAAACTAGGTVTDPSCYRYTVTVTDALGFQASTPQQGVGAVDCRVTLSPIAVFATLPSPFLPAGSAGPPFPAATYATYSSLQLDVPVARGGGCTNALAYSWSFDAVAPGSRSSFNSPTVPRPTFLLDRPSGTWTVRVTVTDTLTGAAVTSAPASFTTDACGSNAITPRATATSAAGGGNGQTALNPTTLAAPFNLGNFDRSAGQTSLQLDGSTSGTAGASPNAACAGPLSFQWTLMALPPASTASVQPTSAAKPAIALDQNGTYTLQLVVSDAVARSAPLYLNVSAVP